MKKCCDTFPESFLWGGAIASAQAEGAYDADGRGATVFDFMPVGKERYASFLSGEYKNKTDMYFPNRYGIDFFHTYKEDIKQLAELGFKAFRFSISWSRIFPTGLEQEPNERGLRFYENIIDELRKYNIEPVVTILHYDIPLYLVENYNGFASRELVDLYEKFAKTLFERFKGKVFYWITINEINIMRYCPLDAGIMQCEKDDLQLIFQSAHHQFLASAKAVIAHNEICGDSQIGMMLGYEPAYPKTCNPKDVLLAEEGEDELMFFSDVQVFGYYPESMKRYFAENGIDIDMRDEDAGILLHGKVDYIALSYYSSAVCSSDPADQNAVSRGNIIFGIENPHLAATDWGWTIDPMGLQISLMRLYRKYRIPLFIVECGIGVREERNVDDMIMDYYRIAYFHEHLKAVRQAIEKGIEVMGFLSWSPIDLPSAATGELEKRYGFIYVDADNYGNGSYARHKKLSYSWYKEVIDSNGASLSDD